MTEFDISKCKWQAKTGFYSDILANWPVEAGKKPALYLFAAAHLAHSKKRPGLETGYVAMALRPNGVTVDEYMLAFHCGPAFNNFKNNYVKTGVVTVEPVGGERPIRVKATLTPRGIQYIEAAQAALEAEKVTQKATPKAKKPAKGPSKPTGEVISEPATLVAPAETPTSELVMAAGGHDANEHNRQAQLDRESTLAR